MKRVTEIVENFVGRVWESLVSRLFPGGKVPEQVSVEDGEQLVAGARALVQEATAELARKSALLEDALAAEALAPNDSKRREAATAADNVHHTAELGLKRAEATLRAVSAKLEAAQARGKAEADQAHAVEVRATAARQVEVGDQIDAALDLVWAGVREFQSGQIELARGNRDVMMIMVDARQLIESRLQSRFGGTSRLVGFGMVGRNIAATACEGLPKSPAAGNDGAVEAPPAAPAPPPGGAAARAET